MTAPSPASVLIRQRPALPAPRLLGPSAFSRPGGPPAAPPVPVKATLIRDAYGTILRRSRHAQGLSLRDVAARAHISLGYLSEVERGIKEPSSEVLEALAAAVGMRVSDLVRHAADLIDHAAARPAA